VGEGPVYGRRPYSTGPGPGKGVPRGNSTAFVLSLRPSDRPPALEV